MEFRQLYVRGLSNERRRNSTTRSLKIVTSILMCVVTLAFLYANVWQESIRTSNKYAGQIVASMSADRAIDSKVESTSSLTTMSNRTLQIQFQQMKHEICQQRWLGLFPAVKDMVQKIGSMQDFPSFAKATSVDFTTVTIDSTSRLIEEGELKATIKSHDHDNISKSYGGDFFQAILHRSEEMFHGEVSCDVIDKIDGSYEVTCPLPWQGNAILNVTLINTSEYIYLLLMYTNGRSEPGVFKNHSFVNSEGVREYGICDIHLQDKFSEKQLCDHSNQRNGEPWYCVKPPSGECPPIERQLQKVVDSELDRVVGSDTYGVSHSRDLPFHTSAVTIRRQKTDGKIPNMDMPYRNGGERELPLGPYKATGWLDAGVWRTRSFHYPRFNPPVFAHCCRDKILYFIGESTMYQWYAAVIATVPHIVSKDPDEKSWGMPQKSISSNFNLTIYYRSHGPPLHIFGPPSARPYITDTLDAIKTGGSETHILFTIGVHMVRYHPDVYLHRLAGIKRSVQNLLRRLPEVNIYVIGLHSSHGYQWLLHRFEVLLRHTFSNMAGVVYLPYWDMLAVLGNKLVHPKAGILSLELGVFQTHICGSRTSK